MLLLVVGCYLYVLKVLGFIGFRVPLPLGIWRRSDNLSPEWAFKKFTMINI